MLPLLAAATAAAVATSNEITFAVPFTNDAVLQRGPAVAAVYGLVAHSTTGVKVTVTDDANGSSYTVHATLRPASSAGGTSNPLCQQRCLSAGFCAVGEVSSCVKPSCAMGCILAGRTATAAACKTQCTRASANWNASCNVPSAACNQGNPAAPKSTGFGCNFVVPSPADTHHSTGEITQNETFTMCADRAEGWSAPPVLSNGTQCTSCNTQPECEMGCRFGSLSSDATDPPPPLTWKAFLKPHAAGGSYTISATVVAAAAGSGSGSTGGVSPASETSLRRITFGDVFLCSGQSNMALALEYSFKKPKLDLAVSAGKYDNIRLLQYGDMSVKYEELEPAWVTTTGTLNDVGPTGGTWANLSAASKPIVVPPPTNPQWGKSYNLYSQFSATCFYFGTALTDHRRQTDIASSSRYSSSSGSTEAGSSAQGKDIPIGLIQSAIGGSMIEAWMPDRALSKCTNESLAGKGQSPPSRLFKGMIAPFVNFTLNGWLWYQVRRDFACYC